MNFTPMMAKTQVFTGSYVVGPILCFFLFESLWCLNEVAKEAHLRVQGLQLFLGRALGHFIFSLIGLKRILFTNISQKL